MLFTQLEQLTSEDFAGCCLSAQLPQWHAKHTSNSGGLESSMNVPADEIKQMLRILWHLMKQSEVFQETKGPLASTITHLLLVLPKPRRCSDIYEGEHDFVQQSSLKALKKWTPWLKTKTSGTAGLEGVIHSIKQFWQKNKKYIRY